MSTCAQKSSCLKSKYPSYISARRVSRYEGRDVTNYSATTINV